MKKILIVEDCPMYTALLKVFFNRYPLKIHYSNSVEKAFDALFPGEYDMIISNYNLPGKNGFEFLKYAKSQKLAKSFILMTSNKKVRSQCEDIDQVVDCLMFKPFFKGSIDNLINRYINV